MLFMVSYQLSTVPSATISIQNLMAFENSNPPRPLAVALSNSFTRLILAAFLCLYCFSDYASCESVRKTYIVHVSRPPPDHVGSHRDWHEALLSQLSISTNGGMAYSGLVYSYTHVLSGFAARLTEEELEAIKNIDGFVHAEPDKQHSYLHTTHSPAFLGLYPGRNSFWGGAVGYGSGVIIGVVDSGVDPRHPSFNDEGMPPPPQRWKGKCEFSDPSLCNNKLIGARLFDSENQTGSLEPSDNDGHGTHTASTATGRFVPDASLLGSARGTAAGVAPDAWLAVYKVGSKNGKGMHDSDIIAAIDRAVKDGVDVLSLSFGAQQIGPYYNDSIAIASFGAVRKGVFVSTSAGNDGPTMGTLGNTAPWMLTVGASTIDRRIRSVVVLGNGEELEGQSAYQPTNFTSSFLPLVHASSYCHNRTLQSLDVSGKLVICSAGVGVNDIKLGQNVQQAGGAGMIYIGSKNDGLVTDAHADLIPTSHISSFDKFRIAAYWRSANLTGEDAYASIIFKGTEIGLGVSFSAPGVAPFSSRGPSIVNPGILKPDIIGPGVNILAASHKPVGPFSLEPAFNILSGTSMSCPHLSGVAALLKNSHPNWSPAMIKSAMMTTAELKNLKGAPITDLLENRPADYFATGSGQVNPVLAINPGLVYDIKIDEYISYLCGLGYTDKQVSMITTPENRTEQTHCSAYKAITEADLNYPSLTVDFSSPTKFGSSLTSKQVTRTVINVGEPFSSYKVRIIRPPGVLLTVLPEILFFTEAGQEQSFVVVFELSRTEPPASWFSEGLLTWVSYDGKITVSSPISVLFGKPSA